MTIQDAHLQSIVTRVGESPSADILSRTRGGFARGMYWAEMSGRIYVKDGEGMERPDAWAELRIHHRPNERRVQAGLLLYQPLSKGGRTIIGGEISLEYREGAGEVVDQVTETIGGWLDALARPDHPARQ